MPQGNPHRPTSLMTELEPLTPEEIDADERAADLWAEGPITQAEIDTWAMCGLNGIAARETLRFLWAAMLRSDDGEKPEPFTPVRTGVTMIDSPVFSNGTMGSMWQASWCAGCEADHRYHPGGTEDAGCPVMLRLVVGDFPIEEFTDNNECGPWDLTKVTCTAYRRCRPCAGEPVPPPECVGQIDIFGGMVANG